MTVPLNSKDTHRIVFQVHPMSTCYLLIKTYHMIKIINPSALINFLQSTLLLVLAITITEPQAQGADAWLYQEAFIYSENHDPSLVYLEDGRQLEVQYRPEIEWEDAEKWPKGKKLFIGYNLRDQDPGRTPDENRVLHGSTHRGVLRVFDQRNGSATGSDSRIVSAAVGCGEGVRPAQEQAARKESMGIQSRSQRDAGPFPDDHAQFDVDLRSPTGTGTWDQE
jgi:hypothetical protein